MSRISPGLLAYWLLSAATWLLVNVLAGVGAVALLFALMANATWHGLFVELEGLSTHFLAAPLTARVAFEALAIKLLAGAITLTSLARIGALRAALSSARSLPDG